VDVNVCSYDVGAESAHCDVRVRTDQGAKAKPGRNGGSPAAALGNNGAYDPAYLQSAYNVASAAAAHGGGAGQIVAIVDAYDDPTVSSDLASYRSFFGLPACPAGTVSPASSSCVFQKVNQSGGTSYPAPNRGWSTEIALDVEMVSAICPSCQILLVEANTNFLSDLGAAVNEAVSLGANVVSNSYGAGEYDSESADAAAYYAHPGVAIVASSGDSGYGVEFPAAAPVVTAVGGTSLTQLTNTGTRNGSETAWSGAGAGCSVYEPKPGWQHDGGCSGRAVADVAAVADPNTGVWIYDTYGSGGWAISGGTSVAAPIVGAFYGLAGNDRSSNVLAAYPYGAASSLYDVTSGSDGACSPSYLCTAGQGYDGPTGLGTPGGTPNSIAAFQASASVAAPAVASLKPSSGPAGTPVVIGGSGFTGASSVTFNGAAAAFTVTSDSSLTATVPTGATTGPVSVTTPAGTGSSASSFTVTTAPVSSAVTYQIDAAHDGVQTDPSLAPPLARRWSATFPTTPSYALIAQGKVFVTAANSGTSGSTLYALDQATGATVWSQPIPGTYGFSAAAYDAGRVYVVNFDGLLRAFDAAAGSQAWSTQLPVQWAFTSPPVAAGGVVYTGGAGSGGTVYAVDEQTGALLATQPVENGDHSSPAVSDAGVFVSYACDQSYGFAKPLLSSLWHYSTSCEGGGGATAVYANGRVYTRDPNGNLILDAAGGTLQGSFAAGDAPLAPAVDRTSMFVLTGSTLSATGLTGGTTRWAFAGDGHLDTAPIAVSTPAGEYVIEGSSTGMLYALDAATGAQVWSANVGASIPRPDEHNAVQLTGLSAGQGLLVVPGGNTLSAFAAAPAIPPGVPTSVAATAGDGRVSLAWSAPSTGTPPVTYNVYRGTAPGKEAASPIATGLTGTGYVSTGLANGTTYYFEITATNGAGTSGFSTEVSATPVTVPGAPTQLNATTNHAGGVSLNWRAPSSNGGSPVTGYRLYRGTSAGGETALTTVSCTTSTCSFTDTSTKKNTTYVYQVAAANAAGTGPRSNEDAARAR
jgi:outer membrane protein assembly factor BamB